MCRLRRTAHTHQPPAWGKWALDISTSSKWADEVSRCSNSQGLGDARSVVLGLPRGHRPSRAADGELLSQAPSHVVLSILTTPTEVKPRVGALPWLMQAENPAWEEKQG